MGKVFTLLWTARKRFRLISALLRDKRIPTWQKSIPFLPLIYILSPMNFITMAIPIIGQMDDVILIVFAMDLFESVVDKQIIAQYKESGQD